MLREPNFEHNECTHSGGFASRLFFFMLGGSIGAAVALLFAPKRGDELRKDIANEAARRYEETRDAANRLKDRTGEYYEDTREKGEKVLNVVADGAAVVKRDIVDTAEKISGIVRKSA